jgi:two-component sensor histidine kinase
LVVVATLKNSYDIPTVLDLAEWYFWSTIVSLGWLIALASLIVRWRRGNALLRRQIIGYAVLTVIMIVVLFLSTAYGPLPYLEPAVIVALWPVAVVISIAIAVLQYHLYDVRLVIRRVVVYGGLTVALTALFIGVYFAVLAALSGQVVATRYRWVAVVVAVGAVLAAEPVRRRIQIRMERRFLGERGDPLGVLRKGMTPGTTDEQDAERLASRLRDAATQIRQLAHDLQPAPVDDRGLKPALTDYIATLDGPDVPHIQLRVDAVGSLPAGVTQGAYLVVLEALNNVVRHAHASDCEVTMTLESDELVLRVADNGVGLAQPYVSGIGITSMRSRVQALGGVFALDAAANGGTLLQARIPVES